MPPPIAPPITCIQSCGAAPKVLRVEGAAERDAFVDHDRALRQQRRQRAGDRLRRDFPSGGCSFLMRRAVQPAARRACRPGPPARRPHPVPAAPAHGHRRPPAAAARAGRDRRKTRPAAAAPTRIACRTPASVLTAASMGYGTRPSGCRPRPRSMRRLNICADTRAPVAAAIRCASAIVSAVSALLPSSSSTVSPERRISAAVATAKGAAACATGTGRAGATLPPSSQQVSDGRISVAIWPWPLRAACTATAASAPTSDACRDVRTQPETPRAQPSVSAVSGASSGRWNVAWSPTQFSSGDPARRALCRLARPFASPGPQCSSVAAGLPAMRRIAVGGAGHHALEQPEHAAHPRHAVKCRHEMHLAGAGIGETGVHAAGKQ